jgi:hypothetical protein
MPDMQGLGIGELCSFWDRRCGPQGDLIRQNGTLSKVDHAANTDSWGTCDQRPTSCETPFSDRATKLLVP